MKIVMSEQAFQWFSDEMDVAQGDTIRFYARYGGSNPFHEGFSLGMSQDSPINPSVVLEHNGTTFFIEQDDTWFFNNHDLYVDVDRQLDELKFDYK
ncbi:HesB/YadR/YfhF family protein [Rummeliibacillus sp. G93]|uniref:FeS cluster biogenesis domain-containing protein n=1 Tax=Rummeliibacillus stabekisii TaxID=241244 RepID=A0A143HB73_9BACL|nr:MULTISPECIES: HesB/YadR/YfhF family protein [Rummeliibacillus]AMW98977.1 hypothetical protein ATY39_05600 [Rummeliibacillus stabekisii]UQW98913.1 HesB/YadR/YfhF family protein [Rummeliibacillus sp. G93]